MLVCELVCCFKHPSAVVLNWCVPLELTKTELRQTRVSSSVWLPDLSALSESFTLHHLLPGLSSFKGVLLVLSILNLQTSFYVAFTRKLLTQLILANNAS